MKQQRIQHIVILGGGSAGWLTAGLLAAEHGQAGGGDGADESGIQVTVIESPDIPIIGVGEGTWPSMRSTLQKIGLSETALFKDCDAAFKQGAKFARWVNGERDDYYYHPLLLPHGFYDTDVVSPWLVQTQHRNSFASTVCCQPHICEQGLAPKQISTPEYASVANYAYHLDAVKMGKTLQQHCTTVLGVKHILGTVIEVRADDNGDIAALITREHGEITGDLFVDCSGMRSLLLGEHFKVGYESKQQVLFNDSAIAVQIPYPNESAPIASHTIATAHQAGWIWDIGLPTRKGIGIVYASDYMDKDKATDTLLEYAAESIGADAAQGLQPRHIPINPGHRSTFWKNNCVAIGLSAGFLEPLEASALVLVESAAGMLSENLPTSREVMPLAAKRFNERMHYYWETIIDFLKLHYVLSQRDDSQYWLDHRTAATASESLNESLALWRTQIPNRYDFPLSQEMFPAASWHYVLYGMGFRTEFNGHTPKPKIIAKARELAEENRRMTAQYLAALPNNRELVNKIHQYGMQKV
ncbi:MAG: tryptophan halogenase family protein [Pseudohongiellaceae bacterium]